MKRYLVTRFGGSIYAIPLSHVRAIVPVARIIPIPDSDSIFSGVAFFERHLLPIYAPKPPRITIDHGDLLSVLVVCERDQRFIGITLGQISEAEIGAGIRANKESVLGIDHINGSISDEQQISSLEIIGLRKLLTTF